VDHDYEIMCFEFPKLKQGSHILQKLCFDLKYRWQSKGVESRKENNAYG